LLNKNLPWVFFSYTFSYLYFFCNSSWFFLWVGVEINSITFLAVLLFYKNIAHLQSAISYFLIQSTSSCLIIYRFFRFETNNSFNLTSVKLFLFCSLFLKLGVSPLHSWLISIVNRLPLWLLWLVLRIQKIMPFIMIINLKTKPFLTVLLRIIISSILGSFFKLQTEYFK